MTFAVRETSLQDAAPIELYQFDRLGFYWRYTSANEDQTVGTNIFTAAAIKRGTIDQTNERSRSAITLTVPRDLPFVTLFRGAPPSDVILLTITMFHRGDNPVSESSVVWMGRVANVKFTETTGEIMCEPIHVTMRRSLLRRRYQLTCPHVLYDQGGCKLDKTLFAESVPDTTQSLNVLTAAGFATKPDGYFAGGWVEFGVGGSVERRFVTDHTGSQVVLDLPFLNFPASGQIVIYPGCDHAAQTCLDKFNNILNYGGQPFYGDKNPMTGISVF